MERKNERPGKSEIGDNDGQPETVTVTASDVLLGRGNLVNNSAGNQMFRGLVRENAGEYVRCESRAQKELIARRIVSQVEQYGGRFMRQVDGEGILPSWEVVSDDVALSKVRQALRDMAQQPTQSPAMVDALDDPPPRQESASLVHADEENDVVQNLVEQIFLYRQEAADQAVRLRALLAELETSAATAGLSTSPLTSTGIGTDDIAFNDLHYARALQESELREELAQLRRRSANLSSNLGDFMAPVPTVARLGVAQRQLADDLLRRYDEETALRQYHQLRLLDSQIRASAFTPINQGPLGYCPNMDHSLMSRGVNRIGDTTSLDLLLRGAHNPLTGTSLMTPAIRHDSQVSRSRDRLCSSSELAVQPSVDHGDCQDEDEDMNPDNAVDSSAARGRMKQGDS